MSPGAYVEKEHLPQRIQQGAADVQDCYERRVQLELSGLSVKDAQKELEEKLIARALLLCEGNKSRAAQLLELSYPSLLSKIKQYELS